MTSDKTKKEQELLVTRDLSLEEQRTTDYGQLTARNKHPKQKYLKLEIAGRCKIRVKIDGDEF